MGNKIKILFLIHDLGGGGAEKVLVNLVNNMDQKKFDVTVLSLFAGGVNEQYLKPFIRYKYIFSKMIPGNSKLMKLLAPEKLHQLFIRDQYDIEVAYLEGPSTRIISGSSNADAKKIAWVHSTISSEKAFSASYRNFREAKSCYEQFNRIAFVSEDCKVAFEEVCHIKDRNIVVSNVLDTDEIIRKAAQKADITAHRDTVKMISVGKLLESKGCDRLLRIADRLKKDRINFCLYFLGSGTYEKKMLNYIQAHKLHENVKILGYVENPYKYLSSCDLFVCASYSEGFSTATLEAIITGTPICTVDVSGMKEMLGEGEYGLITENNEEALYQGIKQLILDPQLLEYYKHQAAVRSKDFYKEKTVERIEEIFKEI